MTNRQLFVGAKVYHSIFVHWGEGKVIAYRDKDNLGYKVRLKWRVQWQRENQKIGSETTKYPVETWESCQSLRKTPKGGK